MPERIAKLQKIIDNRQYAKVDGVPIDMFTASLIISTYNRIGEKHRDRFASLSIEKMVTVANRLNDVVKN